MREVMPMREGAVAVVTPQVESPPPTHAPEGSPDASVEVEEPDIELDYDSMESMARLQPRAGVNWRAASLGARTYEDIFSPQYELASEDGR